MIEIKTTINKDLNEIIFFEELFGFRNSEWSKERRSEYSKYFKSENIKKYRNNFLNVFNEIPDGLIESIFALPKKERYEILKKEFGEEKSKQIKNLLKDLSKNFSYVFNKVWEDKEKKLKILKKILYTNTENVHKSLSEINSLLEIKNSKKIEVEVCLIFGSNFNNDINAYFSKTKNKRTVFVDGYFVDKKNKNFSSLLVVHELIHILLRESKKIEILKNFAKENEKQIRKILLKNKINIDEEIFLEELFISLFAPEGYFQEKYYGNKIIPPKAQAGKPIRMKDLRKLKAYKLKNMVSNYIENKKCFDYYLLNEIIKNK